MQPHKAEFKVLIAVDPEFEWRLVEQSCRSLRAFAHAGVRMRVDMICVVAGNKPELTARMAEMSPLIAQSCGKRSGVAQVGAPQVIRILGRRKKSIAEATYQHALAIGADLIIAPTHGRHGLRRAKKGSFVESFVALSDIPLLTLAARTHVRQSVKRILFPTDFQGESKLVLKSLMDLAGRLHASVSVLYVAPVPVDRDLPLLEPAARPFGDGQRPPAWLPDHLQNFRASEAYTDHLRVHGIEAEALFDFSGNSVEHVINTVLRTGKFDLLAVSARSGVISSIIAGITSRRLARTACRPVWLLHEKPVRAGMRLRKKAA